MTLKFEKSFTQQEPISEKAIARVVEILRTGRLHRYNTTPGETAEAALLEEDYARYQGSRHCLPCASGGYALHVAMRSAGLKPGDKVLANAWTLAPVPGAIHNAGGVPVFVEIDENWHIDPQDLQARAEASGARFLMLSHMRGHIGDMEAIANLCDRYGITMIEDCAHTMGARFKGRRSGRFGRVAAFSAQTYKHLNSGEGGLLTTDDPDLAARAVVMSGSYMLYARHGAAPDEEVFRRIRLDTPNYSGRMDNVRAAILRVQLEGLDENIRRWNARWHILAQGLRPAGLDVPERAAHEDFVGSSIQFHARGIGDIPAFVASCAARGVELKWFGADEPQGFTSRFDSWRYLGETADLPRTRAVLATTLDMRVPLTFEEEDCRTIARIIAEEAASHAGKARA